MVVSIVYHIHIDKVYLLFQYERNSMSDGKGKSFNNRAKHRNLKIIV